MTQSTPQEASVAGVAMEKSTVAYRTVEGHAILADVHRPVGTSNCAVIAYFHGGALIGGHRELNSDYTAIQQVFELARERGYAFVSFDYRLAPETELPDIVSDVEAAIAWLASDGARLFDLDASRLIVTGDSAGGYLALLTGCRARPRPQALVAIYGYGSLNAPWYTAPNPYPGYNRTVIAESDFGDFREGPVVSDARERTASHAQATSYYFYLRQNGLWTHETSGFASETLAVQIAPYEPVRQVTRHHPPTFLMHGTMDSDVPCEESRKMAAQFERHGVPYIFKAIDRAEHGFAGGDPDQLSAAYASMRQFMMRYLEADT